VDFLQILALRDNVLKIVITSVITGIVSITFAAIKSFLQCNTGLWTIMLIFLGLILVCGSLLYVRVGKKEEEERVTVDEMAWGKPRVKPVPRYTEGTRRFALVGIIAILSLTLAGFAVWKVRDSIRPGKIVILVANFDGPDQGITQEVLKQLRDSGNKYASDLLIKSLKETITEQDGSETAREKGNCFKASIVLWGWYRGTDSANGYIYFEVLKGPQNLRTQHERPIRNADVAGFKIQPELSSEMSYLALLTIGLARYEAEEYQSAIDRFNDALQQQIPKDMISPAAVHFFKGLCHYEIAQAAQDRVALETAIREFDKCVQDLNAATRDLDDEKMKWSADFNSVNAKMLLGDYPNGQYPREIFRSAALAYEHKLKDYVDAGISEWAVKNNWGYALYQLGRRLEGAERTDRLKDAVMEYNDAIEVCKRERQEHGCALTYYNLGNTLYELGVRGGDEWLEQAETEFRNAINQGDAISPDIVNSLANVQVVMGDRTPGEPGNKFLRNGVETYQSLLRIYEKGSRQHATTQYNLGYALLALSNRVDSEEAKEKLLEAEKAFRVALEVNCQNPLCAKVERDLGGALHKSGDLSAGKDRTDFFEEAMKHLDEALLFFTPEGYPQENRKISAEREAIYRELNSPTINSH